MRCQAYWYEKYVNKVHRPYEGERDDALAIGIAVHDALEAGYSGKGFVPTAKVMSELQLSYEAQLEVKTMCEYYRQAYPSGPVEFEWNGLEEPLSFKLAHGDLDIIFLAKVDGWFRVKEPITVSGGVGDVDLAPGIYSFETKTKRSGFDRGLYIAEWQSGLQASFQVMTMQANAHRFGFDPKDVKGVLVNVIERPKVYEPRRTCDGCRQMYEVRLYKQDGKAYLCPACGHSNIFKGTIPQARVDPPFMWRFMVERGDERLAYDQANIINVATLMQATKLGAAVVPNATQCVNTQWRSLCEYYAPHNNPTGPVQAKGWTGFVEFNPTAYLER